MCRFLFVPALLFAFVQGSIAANLDSAVTLKTPPTNCGAFVTTPPAAVTSFAVSDPYVVVAFSLNSAHTGDVAAVTYITPAGQIYAPASGPWDPLTADDAASSHICFQDESLFIAGTQVAGMLGTWSVKISLNNVVLATLSFTIGSGGTPTCTYALTPASASVGASGGNGSFNVNAGSGCSWTASSNATWLAVAGGASGSGNGTVSFSAAANSATAPRAGVITVQGQNSTVTQAAAAAPCTYGLSATAASVAASGGTGSFNVSAASGCSWTASSNATWLTVTSGASGNGSGSVNYSATANTASALRAGIITVQGQTFTVTQAAAAAACTYGLSADSASVAASGGSGSFNVSAGSGCSWTASSNATWLSVTSGSSGNGNGTVNYSATANTATASRTGIITVQGQTFTVTQAGVPPVPCTPPTLSITGKLSLPGSVSGAIINVTAPANCPWTASTDSPDWIAITKGSTGSGNGEVDFTVTANPLAAKRTGTLTIAGHDVTIIQDSGTPPAGAPKITSVANAASQIGADLPGGGIAQGAIFRITGSNLGPGDPKDAGTGVKAGSLPLADTLANVSMQVKQGSTTLTAYPLFAWTGYVDAIMPSNMPPGNVTITLSYKGVSSLAMPATVVASNFGAFTITGASVGQALLMVQSSATDSGVQNSNSVTAAPGQTVTLIGTGLGAIGGPDNASPPVDDLPASIQVMVSGVAATPIHAGRVPGQPGKDQIQFQVPAGVPSACSVPVQVVTSGTLYSNVVSMAIDANGQACTSLNPFNTMASKGGNLASVSFIRGLGTSTPDVGPPKTSVYDIAMAHFTATPAATPASPASAVPLSGLLASLPALGTCGGLGGSTSAVSASDLTGIPAGARGLDAGGSLSLAGPVSTVQMVGTKNDDGTPVTGAYGLSGTNSSTDTPLFLGAGDYTLTGAGGNDVGAFTARFTLPAQLSWTNRDTLTTIDRGAGVTFTWSGGTDSQIVLLAGGGSASGSSSSSSFICSVPSTLGTFTVPPSALVNMPAGDPGGAKSGGLLFGVVPAGAQSHFTASGLDDGVIVYAVLEVKSVTVK
jgi:uncharacterized protein (TIGR03437 family)